MSRPLDHFVIGVQDLAAASSRFAAMGFTVGTRNRHAWGTENHIIQLADHTFFELITVASPELVPAHAGRAFSFGAFVRDRLAEATGLSMLVLKSDDAVADAARWAAEGIGDFEPFRFGRKGRRPDGSEVDVSFTLAFAADPALPKCGFFACQQHAPDMFWSAAMQNHRNGATGIARVTLVAENPSDHHIFLAGFVGERRMRSTSFGIEIEAGHGLIDIVSPEGFAFRYGEPAPASETPVFAGIEIGCARLSTVEAELDAAGETVIRHGGGLTLPRRLDLATTLRFVESGPRT
ncbi:MAG: VOC family protein [Beijerinckiaceae bacterium]|nr:VOC family protein [Beijerinckiaceae bacterium]